MTRVTRLSVILLGSSLLSLHPVAHGQSQSDRSVHQGGQALKVAFANQTATPVTAFWMDFNGAAQVVGVIPSGQIVELTTFPGHLTVFSSQGRQLSSFRASTFSHGTAFGIVGPSGSADPSKPKIAVCWAPPRGTTNTPGGTGSGPGSMRVAPGGSSATGGGITRNDLNSLIQTIFAGAPVDPTDTSVRITSTPPPASVNPNTRKYTGLYRGKQSTFELTWENADGSGNVRGMMITEGDMASSFSGGESSPGMLEVEVSADLNPINHKLTKVIQGGRISWVGDYITLTEVK